MAMSDHQHLLRTYLDTRHAEGAKAIDALVEMQTWVTDNMKAEHTRVWDIVRSWERGIGFYQRKD